MGIFDIPRQLTAVRRRLRTFADPGRAAFVARFFKTGSGEYGEGDRFLGLRAPELRRVAQDFRSLSLADIRSLLASRWHEERLLACDSRRSVRPSAPQIVGGFLARRSRAPLYRLAKSKSIWERRIAIIATQHFIRLGEFDETLALATALLDDAHDLIHKAAGWMLREVGKRDRPKLEAFLRENVTRMPRTMLRYAIERFPAPLRRKYLSYKRGIMVAP